LLKWDDPARWRRRQPSNPMRIAEYLVPRAAGDGDDAECSVVTFGAAQGGSLDDNVARWVKQFDPVAGPPTRRTRVVNGMHVTRVELTGAYHPMRMRGGPPAPSSLPDSRLIGAIVEAPSGEWFFKMTGPAATVKTAAQEFDAMVDSARPK
jgi:hypothetical protein